MYTSISAMLQEITVLLDLCSSNAAMMSALLSTILLWRSIFSCTSVKTTEAAKNTPPLSKRVSTAPLGELEPPLREVCLNLAFICTACELGGGWTGLYWSGGQLYVISIITWYHVQ